MTTDNRHNRIDNIEFNVHDITRSKAFYGAVFGWTFTDFGPTYSEFSDGRLSGGFTTGEPVRPGGPLIILYADDLAQAQQAISAAGGQITRPEFKFPGAAASTSPTSMATNWPSGRRRNPPSYPLLLAAVMTCCITATRRRFAKASPVKKPAQPCDPS